MRAILSELLSRPELGDFSTLASFDQQEIVDALLSLSESGDDIVLANTLDLCAQMLGPQGEPVVRAIASRPFPNLLLTHLCHALEECVLEDGFEIAINKVENERIGQMAFTAMSLLAFANRAPILDWIETRFRKSADPVTPDWGELAALCGVSWQRITSWLDAGRPLSIIALDALHSCYEYNTPRLEDQQPQVLDAPSLVLIDKRLEAHKTLDDSPRSQATITKLHALLRQK